MAIIKLGDVFETINPINQRCSNDKNGIKVYKISNFINNDKNFSYMDKEKFLYLKQNSKTPQKDDLLISRVGTIGEIFLVKNDGFYITDNFIWMRKKEGVEINIKYVYYLLNKNKLLIKLLNSGSTQPLLVKSKFINLSFSFPSLEEQRKIIDIIEPFEKKLRTLEEKLSKISILENELIKKSKNIGLMINNDIIFERGKGIDSKKIVNFLTKTPFINISYINGKLNKWILDSNLVPNINIGDILLSLDGTPGLINNFVYGYNGYGYKVYSNLIDNYMIYYSLKHKNNQEIIRNNSKGSVILHSSSSINYLNLYHFKNNNILDKIYCYSLNLKYKIEILKAIVNSIIKLKII